MVELRPPSKIRSIILETFLKNSTTLKEEVWRLKIEWGRVSATLEPKSNAFFGGTAYDHLPLLLLLMSFISLDVTKMLKHRSPLHLFCMCITTFACIYLSFFHTHTHTLKTLHRVFCCDLSSVQHVSPQTALVQVSYTVHTFRFLKSNLARSL